MISLTGRPVKAMARMLGFPEGTGELIPHGIRVRLVLSIMGSLALSSLELLGVMSMVPLMQYVTGMPRDSGVLGVINTLLGHPGNRLLVTAVAATMVGAFVVKDVASYFFRRWQLRFMASNQVAVSTRMLEQYLVGPYGWHLSQNTSDKLWTINSAVAMGYSAALSAGMAIIADTFTILMVFGSLMIVSPIVTLGALIYLGTAGLIVQRVIRPRILEASARNLESSQEAAKATLQALSSVKEIKLRRAHEGFVERYRVASKEMTKASTSAALLGSIPSYFLEIVFILGVGILTISTTTGSNPQNGLVLLGIFVAAGTRILPSATRLIGSFSVIRYSVKPLEHLLREHRMLRAAHLDELSWQSTTEVPQGDLKLTDVTFAYPGKDSKTVINGVSLDIPSGTSVALVGSSGAGKSTLVDIILGLHRPASGSVTAGGIDIFSNLAAWQEQLAVVPQEVTLFDDTLRANIEFDETSTDESRLRRAVAQAQLTDIVEALPQGLDNPIGERGIRLSGGQRQRIGIARALFRNPRVLFLDEATSALDNETEHLVAQTLQSLHGDITLVIVAHRLSTVRNADHIVFMHDGEVEAQGTFDAVQKASPRFARLVELGNLERDVRNP